MMACFLSQGIDVELKNARGHTPLDLATEPKTKALLTKAVKTKNCMNCSSKFDFKNLRFMCLSHQDCFYCSNCSTTYWVFENYESDEKERPVCRSLAAEREIKKHENLLREAMDTLEFHTLDSALSAIKDKIDIDAKL